VSRTIKTALSRLFIVLLLVGQLLWLVMPRSGSHPLSHRAIDAARAEAEHPSAATKAAFEQELSRDSGRDAVWFFTAVAAILIVDGACIYWFWNFGYRKHSA